MQERPPQGEDDQHHGGSKPYETVPFLQMVASYEFNDHKEDKPAPGDRYNFDNIHVNYFNQSF
jgi:hypothetical protein